MAKLPCFAELRKVIPKEVDDKTLRAFLDDVGKIQLNNQASGDTSLLSFRQATKAYLAGKKFELASIKKERALNIAKRAELRDFISQFSARNKAEALLSLAGGGVSLKRGINASVDRMTHVKIDSYNSALFGGLESKGVLEVALEGKLDKEIGQELWELSSLQGKPGVSKNAQALAIARVFHSVQSLILQDLRRAGADVHEVSNFIMRQSHNRNKLRDIIPNDHEGSRLAWINHILPRLNHVKTFGADAGNHNKMVDFLKNAYDDIVFGRMDLADGSEVSGAEFGPTFKSKLGRQLSKHRKLFFADANKFYEYNLEFGNDNIMESIQKSIHSNARNSSVIETFGTDPDKMWVDLKKGIRSELKDSPEELARFDRAEKQIDNLFSDVRGERLGAGDSMLAKGGKTLRALTNMGLLGKAAIRSMTDLTTAAAALRSSTGKGFLQAHADLVSEWTGNIKLRVKDKALFRQHMRDIGLIFNDYLAESHARFGADAEPPPGGIAKAQRLYFKLNGLTAQTELGKFAVARAFSKEVASNARRSFDNLTPVIRENMQRYNIDQFSWGIIRQGVDTLPDGTKIISLEKIRQIEGIDPNLKRKAELQWQSYISDHADFGVPTPNARVRNRVVRGTSEDDILGQGLRFLGQFKTFSLAMYDVAGRVVLSNPERPMGDAVTMAQISRSAVTGKERGSMNDFATMMVGMTAMAYVAESLIQIGQGREPPDPASASTWADAFVKGGSAGLYADFILGEYDSGFKNFTTQIAGPTAGLANEVANIYSSALRGEDIASDSFRLLSRRAPFVNIFGVRQALDYMILDKVQEVLSPGYKFRREVRLQREGSEPLFK